MLQQTLYLYQRAYRDLAPSVWLLAGVMLINRCGTMVLPFMTLYLTEHLHYSVTDAGIVMAVYGMGAFIGTFLGGRLTDRFGFYYVQLISLLLSGAFLLTLQFITNFYTLCGSVFFFTLFGDAFRPANQAAIAYYSDAATRTRAFSLNRLAINLGWTVGGGLGGWLAGIDYGLIFWADGLTCFVAGVVLWTFLPVPLGTSANNESGTRTIPERTNERDVRLSPYRDRLFIGLVVCNALYLIAFMQFFTIVPLFFKDELHLSVRLIGGLMALNGLLIVAFEMALVYKLEQQKKSRISLILTGAIFATLSYLILTFADWFVRFDFIVPGLSVALGYVLVVTVSEMLVMPFLQSFIVERSNPAMRGQYLALYSMSGALAQTTAPAFGSLMVAQVGFSMHWLAVAGISLVSAGGFWWLGQQKTFSGMNHQVSELQNQPN